MVKSQNKSDFIATVYDKLIPFLYRFGCKFTSDSETVKDSIQDLFLKLCEKEDISNIRSMKYYLLRAFKNILIDNLARRIPEENIDEIKHNNIHEKSSEDIWIEAEEIQQFRVVIEEAFKPLTKRQKEVIQLRYMEQLSYQEIGQMLGIKPKTVRNTLDNALCRIREKIENQTIKENLNVKDC